MIPEIWSAIAQKTKNGLLSNYVIVKQSKCIQIEDTQSWDLLPTQRLRHPKKNLSSYYLNSGLAGRTFCKNCFILENLYHCLLY